MKYYLPDGTEITAKEFVNRYSEDYFLKEIGKKGLVPDLYRNSEYIEKEIEKILHEGIKDERDVARIIAWKIAKIRHRESEENQEFRYASDWVNAEQLSVTRYSKPFPLEKIAHNITNNIEKLEKLAVEDPQGLLNAINKPEYKGMGSVYLVTLLYFLSKGEYPIYDQFAMMSLTAIISGASPILGEKVAVDVKFKELPTKDSTKFSEIMKNEMAQYIKMLNDIFGDEWKTNRKIDQALWVYGHLFKEGKRTACS